MGLEHAIIELESSLQSKRARTQEIKNTLTECDKKIQAEREKCEKGKRELKTKQAKQDHAEEQVITLHAELKELSQTRETLLEEKEYARQQLTHVKEQVTRLTNQVNNLKTQIIVLKNELRWFYHHFTVEFPSGVCNEPQHRIDYQEKQAKERQLNAELITLSGKLEAAQRHVQLAQTEFNQIEERINKHYTEVEAKQQEVSRLKREIERLKADISSLESQQDLINDAINSYERENKRLQFRLELNEEEIKADEIELIKLQAQLAKQPQQHSQNSPRRPHFFNDSGPSHHAPPTPTDTFTPPSSSIEGNNDSSSSQEANRNFLEEAARDLLDTAADTLLKGIIDHSGVNEVGRKNIKAFNRFRKEALNPLIDDIGDNYIDNINSELRNTGPRHP